MADKNAQTGGASDVAAYCLVLQHTLESGHGWGASPAPLRGFYVLDRTVPGVQDPSFNPDSLEDLKFGIPLSSELKEALLRSADDVAPIAFVSQIKELIDLKLPAPVQISGGRGFIALGQVSQTDAGASVGVYFYAGARWSRSNIYQLVKSGGGWAIARFETLSLS